MDNVNRYKNEETDSEFFELAQQLLTAKDPVQLKSVKEELARIVFGI